MKKIPILLINYKLGNHQSVVNALEYLKYPFLISNSITDIKKAPAYILPGVGAFGEAMKNLQQLKIIPVLQKQVLEKKKPILGICLGMQILAEDSEENGYHTGLGWIKGHVKKIPDSRLRIPQVGWNNVQIIKRWPLFEKVKSEANFYFDHSYYFICDQNNIAATCNYGDHLTAAVQKDNIFGVQFHPEKSQNNGLRLLRSFFKNNHI